MARRFYLRLIDRIPDRKEIDQFAMEKDLRALINRLTGRKDFERTRELFWMDYLKITAPADLVWLRQQIHENTPVNQRIHNWFAMQRTESVDSAAAIDALDRVGPSLFGSRLDCARCHDHPFENWSQLQFMKLAGFFNQSGMIEVPEGYFFPDTKTGRFVAAGTPFGPEVKFGMSRRLLDKLKTGEPWPKKNRAHVAFADWLTDFRENPLPFEVLGARYGEWLTGRTDMVHDVVSQLNPPEIVPHEQPFAARMKLITYDEIELIRAILSEAFSAPKPTVKTIPTLMTRNQWQRSIATALGRPVEELENAPAPADAFLEKSRFIDRILSDHDFPPGLAVNEIWLTTLSRPPLAAEVKIAEETITGSPKSIRELYWSLFLSDEFQTVP